VPKKLSRSPRATILTIAALSSTAGLCGAAPLTAQAAAHARHSMRAHAASRSAAEREALAQEREALRAARSEERAAARAERQAAREQRKATRAQERAARHGNSNAAADDTTTAPSSSSSSASTRGCTVTIETSAASITAGEAVTVFGKVTCPPSSEAGSASAASSGGERQVSIEQTQRGGGAARAFAALGTASTEADGSYQLAPVTLQANTVFRVRLGRHGAHTAVRVAPVVTLTAPSPAEAAAPTALPSSVSGHTRLAQRSRTTFTGTVAPAAPGARVALQISYPADGEQWRTIAYGDVVDGSFSISHGFRIPGEAKVRVLAHPKGANAPGVSEALTYTVAQQQNPQLTILASADPISFAQSVTLSGVAAGGAGQTVTLLARTVGGSFAPVATTTTDESGNYQFVQSPQQSTYYEVSGATAHSAVLFEGVRYVLALAPPPPATLAAGEALAISGSVTPPRAGTRVYLDRRGASGFGFHPIATATVNPDGTFTLTHAFESATSATLRVRVAGDAQNQGSASAPFVVSVTTAPAAALDPEPAAPAS
jgi:hypothetical protein